MTPVPIDRTERCLARAIVLLEAADDLDKLYGESKKETVEQTKAKVRAVINKNMCLPVATVQDTNNAIVAHCRVEDFIRLNNFKSAHDEITRQALLSLIDCATGKEQVTCSFDDVIDNKGNIIKRGEAEHEKRRDNESLEAN